MALKPVSVSQLNKYIGRVLSTDPILMNISVSGEVANMTKHSSGHWYFSLKDKTSTLKCFLLSSRAASLRFEIENGMQVIAYGNVSVYEKGGYYSLDVKAVEAEGEGALQQAFEALKRRLAEEGLFDEFYKRDLPIFPKTVGVITSPTGAAVHDIITTIKRRNPMVNILLYPVSVQGDGSAASVANAIKEMNRIKKTDLLIVGRGGGSMEDLWTFNEEAVARAVFESKIPVISAVGHESDTTICDYVSDARAATPTAAAELAVPHIDNYIDRINSCSPSVTYGALSARVDNEILRSKHLNQLCQNSVEIMLSELESRLKLLKLNIDSNNPTKVLDKGFALVQNENGEWLTKAEGVKSGSKLKIMLADGNINCTVDDTEVRNA
jgi:exodeoxyribonuclease VII large subunit